MPFIPAVVAALALAVFLYHYIIYPVFLSPLSKIPKAHFSSSSLPLWLRWHRRGAREAIHTIFAAHQRCGPIVCLGPSEVSVASLEGLRRVYVGGFERPKWFTDQFMNYQKSNIFSTPGNKEHGERRRMLANVYSKSYIMKSEDMRLLSVAVIFDRLLPVLSGAAGTADAEKDDKGLDVQQLNRALGADWMSGYLFGLGNATDFVRNANEGRKYFTLHDAYLDDLFANGKPARDGVERHGIQLCQAAEKTLRQVHSSESPEQATMPVVYSQLKNRLPPCKPEVKGNIDINPELASEMLDNFVAAQEGTRTTLTFLQWELSKRPKLQHRLRKELLSLDPPLRPTLPGTKHHLPSFQSLDSLPLLDALVTETLRRYPASQSPQFRITPPEGCTIHGYYIPGGITISSAPFCLHRNEEVFPNAELWDPERWIVENDDDEARVREMRRWFWAFSSGPRTCTGRHFALLVIKLVVAATYTSFTTCIVDDRGMEQKDSILSHPVGDALVLRLAAAKD